MERQATLKVFRYVEELDTFLPTREYLAVAEVLGLREWNPVVWIGRLFCMDNDFGEHWFDNWDLRDERVEVAKELGLDSVDLLIVDPDRFQDGKDGPCNPPQLRKRFWTEVLRSLELSYELLFDKARQRNEELRESLPSDVLDKANYIPDLEERIDRVMAALKQARAVADRPGGR